MIQRVVRLTFLQRGVHCQDIFGNSDVKVPQIQVLELQVILLICLNLVPAVPPAHLSFQVGARSCLGLRKSSGFRGAVSYGCGSTPKMRGSERATSARCKQGAEEKAREGSEC